MASLRIVVDPNFDVKPDDYALVEKEVRAEADLYAPEAICTYADPLTLNIINPSGGYSAGDLVYPTLFSIVFYV